MNTFRKALSIFLVMFFVTGCVRGWKHERNQLSILEDFAQQEKKAESFDRVVEALSDKKARLDQEERGITIEYLFAFSCYECYRTVQRPDYNIREAKGALRDVMASPERRDYFATMLSEEYGLSRESTQKPLRIYFGRIIKRINQMQPSTALHSYHEMEVAHKAYYDGY